MNSKNNAVLIFILIACLIYFLSKKEHFTKKRKYLLFSSVGKRDKSGVPFWTKSENRNYDISLYYYDYSKPKNCKDYCINQRGTKFINFYHYYMNNDISQYDVFWIVDDDIQIETKDINSLFELFTKYKLDVAQPSFDKESFISHNITQQQPENVLRYTNFVEVGVFMLSKKAIKKCIDAFNKTNHGMYLDYLVCKLNNNGRNIAIIDEIPCHHPKQERVITKVRNFIKQIDDGNSLLNEYNIRPFSQIEYTRVKKIKDTKIKIKQSEPININNYYYTNTNIIYIIIILIFAVLFIYK